MPSPAYPLVVALASSVLLLIYVLTGVLFWLHDKREFDDGLLRESAALRTTFEIALADLEQQMLTLASMVAADPEVRELFHRARHTVEAEGGAAGAAHSAQLRQALFNHVAPTWQDLQDKFGLRQLHFQFGPGALSFLRVHTPERYGDRMDGLRHIIEDVNRDHQARSGFETGRIYSGVRGVVPVWYEDAQGDTHYSGALEAGTSFETQLDRLDRMAGAGFAVLLRQEHVEDAVWDSYRPLNGPRQDSGCKCYLEATSRDEVRAWMQAGLLPRLDSPDTRSHLLDWMGRDWHLTRFPLRDYLGIKHPERAPVGSVLVWRDMSAARAAWREHQQLTQFALFGAFLLSETLLLWLLHFTRQRLQERIDAATAALRTSERSLQRAQAVASVGSWDMDFDTGHLHWSAETRRIFGLDTDVVPSYAQFLQSTHADDRAAVDTAWQAALQGAVYDIEHRIMVDGEVRWVREQAELVRDDQGRPRSALGIVQDITERRLREDALHRLATTDQLTGLANRRHFLQRLDEEIGRLQRFGSPAALLMLDIDHFKRINDGYGHAAGDAVLVHFAALAAGSLRQIDLVGRLGGEEFAILLPGNDAAGARLLAERLRERVAAASVLYGEHELRLTVSVGLTVLQATDTGSNLPLARADAALYRAKHGGRNRVEEELAVLQPGLAPDAGGSTAEPAARPQAQPSSID